MRLRSILAARLPGGFDRVGDIAVISIVPELEPLATAIGTAILDAHPTIRVAARREGIHDGPYRTRPLRVIAGEQRLTTVHRENGVLLHLDLSQVYFSGRLAHERARIAALIQPGEQIAVLGSGAGPFPLVIGRHSQASEVVGIDINPAAHACALRNLAASRALRSVRFLAGDAGLVLAGLDRCFDRVLIVLPYGGEALLVPAIQRLRPGGILHFYDMQPKGCHRATLAKIDTACQQTGHRWRSLGVSVCGHCGPATHRICLDAAIEPGA
jgi:tRNA (guanine37-N1)-methyltransferase